MVFLLPYRRFLVGGGLLFLLLSLIGAALEARYLRATVLAVAEREATLLGRHLGDLYFRKGIFLNAAGDLEIPSPPLDPVRDDLKSLGIVMLKVYNLRGKIVAATDPVYIGMERADNPSFLTALAGKSVGKVASRKYYRNLYGHDAAEDLLEVYIPLWSPGRNAPEIVLELYRPWSLYQPLIRAALLRTGVAAVILTGAYLLLLLLLVRKAAALPAAPSARDDRPGGPEPGAPAAPSS